MEEELINLTIIEDNEEEEGFHDLEGPSEKELFKQQKRQKEKDDKKGNKQHNLSPTHFFAIRITSPIILKHIEEWQEKVLQHHEQLQKELKEKLFKEQSTVEKHYGLNSIHSPFKDITIKVNAPKRKYQKIKSKNNSKKENKNFKENKKDFNNEIDNKKKEKFKQTIRKEKNKNKIDKNNKIFNLKKYMIKSCKMHLTMFVLHCKTKEEIEQLKNILKSLQTELQQLIQQTLQNQHFFFHLKGISTFGNGKIIYTQPIFKEFKDLNLFFKISNFLYSKLKEQDIEVDKKGINKDLHCTLFKTSRVRGRDAMKSLPEYVYEFEKNCWFGKNEEQEGNNNNISINKDDVLISSKEEEEINIVDLPFESKNSKDSQLVSMEEISKEDNEEKKKVSKERVSKKRMQELEKLIDKEMSHKDSAAEIVSEILLCRMNGVEKDGFYFIEERIKIKNN
ncbi:hypothetical protein ABK040_001588 [Willaertia magna]